MYEDQIKNEDFTTFELATIGSRLVAAIIDNFILSIAAAVLFGLTRTNGGFALSTLVYFLYYWYFWTQRDGQTPGKTAMNIKVIRVIGTSLSAGDAVLRFAGYWISSIFFGLGYFWALFDAQSQAWHDKIAGTYVVKVDPAKPKKKYVSL